MHVKSKKKNKENENYFCCFNVYDAVSEKQ
jgi:hypothetical protein